MSTSDLPKTPSSGKYVLGACQMPLRAPGKEPYVSNVPSIPVPVPVPAASPVRDRRLKARARGVWATLADMAGPSMEVPSALDRLREEMPDGQQAIRNALSSLEEYGYVRKYTQRDARGKICGTIWQLNPRPALEAQAEVGQAA